MVFNSIDYICFFTIVLLLVIITNRNTTVMLRNVILLAASYFFYANLTIWFPILVVYITLINYLAGIIIDKRIKSKRSGETALTISIILSLCPLLFFKYAYLAWPSVLLPVGLSFFTFQALTYTIDLYRGKIELEKNIITFSLFVSFFPTLLCGPIERARNMLPQLNRKNDMNICLFADGVQLFIWGLFKKVVVADRLAQYVNYIYYSPESYSGSTLAIAAIFYSFQIYCDFSGYADMASATGRMLGFDIMRNFNFPYCVRTIKEFWRRWNISLTSWFTEYVYISMGGNRVNQARWIFNITTIFFLSGIWHGATWSFVVWGLMHAALYLLEHFLRIKNPHVLYHIFTFVMVTLAWVFFRIESIEEAWHVVCKICTNLISPVYWGSSTFSTLITIALLILFIGREWISFKGIAIRHSTWECVALLLCIALFGVSSDQFVYFQF